MEEYKVLAFPGVWSLGIGDSSLPVLWVLAIGNALGSDPWRRGAKDREKEAGR